MQLNLTFLFFDREGRMLERKRKKGKVENERVNGLPFVFYWQRRFPSLPSSCSLRKLPHSQSFGRISLSVLLSYPSPEFSFEYCSSLFFRCFFSRGTDDFVAERILMSVSVWIFPRFFCFSHVEREKGRYQGNDQNFSCLDFVRVFLGLL